MPTLSEAIARRAAIRTDQTDAVRLVDRAGDGFPEFEVDDYAGRWLVQTQTGGFPRAVREFLDEPGDPAGLVPRSVYWKPLGDKQSPRYIAGEHCEEPFEVRENGLRYWIDFTAGYSQGIFLDQRENRLRIRRSVALQPEAEILNCFAYTCAFGVAAAAGGARTTNLDLSKRYLDWGKRNYERNAIPATEHDFIFGDVLDWLRRLQKKGRLFDGIILDPPTFSRNDKGEVFRIENDFSALVAAAEAILKPDAFLFCSTNQRTLTSSGFQQLVSHGLKRPAEFSFSRGVMPRDFTGEKYLKSLFGGRGTWAGVLERSRH